MKITPVPAVTYDSIGAVCESLGDNKKALENYNKALTIELSTLGENHPDIAISDSNITSMHDDKGDYNEALKC